MTYERVRSLALTVLVVGTVFAGTGAGSVADTVAAGNVPGEPPDARAATGYHDAGGDAVLELAFTEAIDTTSVNDTTEITATLDDGSTVPIYDGAAGYADGVTERTRTADRLVVETDHNSIDTVTVDGITGAGGMPMDRRTVDVRTASATVDTTGGDSEVYRGANVSLVRGTAVETTFDIEGTDTPDVTRGAGPNSEVYVWDTDERALGTYTISEGTDSVDVTLESLGLSVTLDDATVESTDRIAGTVEANDIDRDVEVTLVDDGDDVATETVRIDADGTAEFAFAPIDAGNYTVEARDYATDVTASTDAFAVGDAGTPTADFAAPTYTEARGDVVAVAVTLNHTDTATVQFGDADMDYYNLTAEVVDEDGDGRVTVLFNTFEAGHEGASPDDVVRVDGDDSLADARQGGPFTIYHPDVVGSDVLQASEYDLRVVAGDTGGVVADPDGVATLSLRERSTTDVDIWTAPADDFDSLADAESFRAFRENDTLTRTDSLATGDLFVVAITANGLEGAYDDTEDFQRLSDDGRLFDLTLETTPGPNGEQETRDVSVLDSDDVEVVSDDTDDGTLDTHYVVIESTALTDLFDHPPSGDSYVADFDVHANAADNDLGPASSDQDTAAIAARSASLDTDEERLRLDAAPNATLRGETTLAPGTDLTLQLIRDGATDPFLVEAPAVVAADGSFSATVNLSRAGPGDNATAQVRLDGDDVGPEYAVHVVDPAVTATPASPTGEVSATAARTTATSTTDTPTVRQTDAPPRTTEAEQPTESTAGASGPGFTAAGAIAALAAAALIAARRPR